MSISKRKNTILISEETIDSKDSKNQSLSSFFREKSEKLQEKLNNGVYTLYPQKAIAEKLNISVKQLQQKLYGQKPLTRDWLIAICAAYGLGADDTCNALVICNMARLDDVADREKFIVNFLENHIYQSVGIFEFNQALDAAKLPLLEISYRKNKQNVLINDPTLSKYKEIRPRIVRTYANIENSYNSLATEYLPNMQCVATAFLEDTNKKRYILEVYSDGVSKIEEEGVILPTLLRQIEPDHEFYACFSELSILVRKKKQKLDDTLNDTKNYQSRFSANIKNDRLHIFYEEFNYPLPERNEYYLMEYIDGHYQMSVAHQSMFMQEYLSHDEYYEHYHTYDKISRKTYSSLKDIDYDFEKKRQSDFYPDLQRFRKRAFSRMQQIVEEKLTAVLQRKIFIMNPDCIFEMPLDILKYYNAEKLFHCTYDPEYGEIISSDESIQYENELGGHTEITFNDIKLAFELGIKSISEICRIKTEKGSLSSLLN